MNITPNRRTYIRERFETSLGEIGVPLCQHPDIIAACFIAIKEMPEVQLHDSVFDIRRRIDEIALKHNLPKQEAREKILAQPRILFGLQEFVSAETPATSVAPPVNIPEIKKIMPSDEEIAIAALKIKFLTKSLPNRGSKRMHLPDTSPDWYVILSNIKERGTTIKKIVLECYPWALKDSETFRKKRKVSTLQFLPSDRVIADSALRFKDDNGQLPNSWGKKIGLPELSAPWPAIIRSLQERGLTISAIVREFYPESLQHFSNAKEKKSRTGKIIPTDQQLADAALKIKAETGRLPNMSSKKSELPDDSYPWSAILPKLTERGTSIGTIVREYHPNSFMKSERQAARRPQRGTTVEKMSRNFIPDHETIADCAINVREVTGYLPNPKNRKSGLPKGSAEWGTIISSLQSQGFTLIGVVSKYYPGVFQQNVVNPSNTRKLAPSFTQPSAKAPSNHAVPKDEPPAQEPLRDPHTVTFTSYSTKPKISAPAPAPVQSKPKISVNAVQPVAVQLKKMPDMNVIAQAAWMYHNTHGRIPDMRSGAEFLPADSHSWPALILAHLKGDNVLRNIMKRYPDNTRRTAHFNGNAAPHTVNGHAVHPEETRGDDATRAPVERRERLQTRQP